jgi:hypothetical protein
VVKVRQVHVDTSKNPVFWTDRGARWEGLVEDGDLTGCVVGPRVLAPFG